MNNMYNEAMKTVGKGCSSDEMFDMALVAFIELNSRMEVAEDEINGKKLQKSSEEGSTASAASGDVPLTESTDRYAGIQPPLLPRLREAEVASLHIISIRKGKLLRLPVHCQNLMSMVNRKVKDYAGL